MMPVLCVLLALTTGGKAAARPAPPPATPRVVAHRGGAALAPENTLGAFDKAIRLGADGLECDVHQTLDSAVVVMHDPDVDRTTDGHGAIAGLTLEQIQALDAAARQEGGFHPEPVPTLADLLALAKDRAELQIEIKLDGQGARHRGIERRVVDALRQGGMVEHAVVISFDLPTLAEVHRLDPHVRTGVLVGAENWAAKDAAKRLAEFRAQTGCAWLLLAAPAVDAATIEAARAAGVRVGAWTVDSPDDARRLARLGVDAVTTNRPDEILKAFGR